MRAAFGLLLLAAIISPFEGAFGDSVSDAASVTVTSPDNDTESTVSVVQRTPSSSSSPQSDSHSSSSAEAFPQRVLSYGNILKQVKKASPGDIVKVALLQRQRGVWTYEFEILDNSGKLTKISVNAQTAAIISKTRR
jgi:uncharacterized membrane protein YkoI